MLKKILIILGIIVIIIIAGFMYLLHGDDKVLNEEVQAIDISTISDGTYVGEYDGYRWSNKLEVVIENGKIIEINILDDQKFSKDEFSVALFEEIIEKQSIDVDGVSGATISTNAYLKAIEDALTK